MDRLTEYREKRDFRASGEPKGDKPPSGGGFVFCVQHHIARRDHYDVRLEWEGALLSWAVPKGVPTGVGERRLAVRVEDHPKEYSGFEGTIPKGSYGAGTVMLWDLGTWRPRQPASDFDERGELKVELFGEKLRGYWTMVRTDGKNWLMIKERDSLVPLGTLPDISVKTGRTMSQIADGVELSGRKNPFFGAKVMLAQAAAALPEGENYRYEIKYDGYRVTAYVESGKATLLSRNGLDCTHRFEGIARALAELSKGRAFVLDGEAVALSRDGNSYDFSALSDAGTPKEYVAFDILALDGDDLRALPLSLRREKLCELLYLAKKPISVSETAPAERGARMLAAAAEMGLEGIMAKRTDSRYVSGRSDFWIKVKCRRRREFVIGGYVTGASGIKALLLGAYNGDSLVYVGRVGSGLSESVKKKLLPELERLAVKEPPFSSPPKPRGGEKAVWTSPKLIAETAYAETTPDGLLRQPSFKGLRDDKQPKDVFLNEQGIKQEKAPSPAEDKDPLGGVKLTSPERKVYLSPPTTKLEVAEYYAAVSERMLPFLRGRAISVVRCHDGVEKGGFFKKHPTSGYEKETAVALKKSDGAIEQWLAVDSLYGLVSQVQSGTVEFHVRGTSVAEPDRPDTVVFDLDPDEGLSLSKVRRGVRQLKEVLDRLNLKSFLKTSGGKGYHVVVPIEPCADTEQIALLAKKTAEYLASLYPDSYTANIKKAARSGKIFIDWQRNSHGATFVAPYSLRARTGAKVSVPIAFDELDSVEPGGIDLKSALKRLDAPDPWEGYFTVRQRVKGV